MVCDWKHLIDKLKWSEGSIKPTSEAYAQSKTRCKWALSESSTIDMVSQLNTNWNKISNTVRIGEKNPPLKIIAHKYRFYPSKEQKAILKNAFGTQRFIRNKSIGLIDHWRTLDDKAKLKTLKDLEIKLKEDYEPGVLPPESYIRKHLIKEKALIIKEHPWLKEYSFDFKDEARRQLRNDFKAAFAKQKIDGKPFRIRKCFDKRPTESFFVPSKHWYSGSWVKFLPKDRVCRDKRAKKYLDNPTPEIKQLIKEGFYPSEINKLPKNIKHAAKVLRHKNEYYIVINMPSFKPQKSKEGLLAIDPGYRTCFTCISFKDNRMEEIGMNMKKVKREMKRAESFQGLVTKAKSKRTRRHMKRRQHKSLDKSKRLIEDLHRSTAKYMCENYSTILVPKLNFHELGDLNKTTKAYAQKVSHCSFVDRLKTKARQYSNCRVIQVTEECTSKTCSMCGSYHTELGSNKTYDCPNCNMSMDRDMNAVYNILMKYLALKMSTSKRKPF